MVSDKGSEMPLLAQLNDATKMLPSPEQVASWSASQTIQWLLVTVLICVGIAAYFGMQALCKSNAAVNANYDKSLTMWENRFVIQDERHDKQESRHAERDRHTHEVLTEMAVNLRTISDSMRSGK